MRKKQKKGLALGLAVLLAASNIVPALAAGIAGGGWQGGIKLEAMSFMRPSLMLGEEGTGSETEEPSEQEPSGEEASPSEMAPMMLRAGTTEITKESDLVKFFPDANFRAAVFAAVKNGADDAVGADVEDALANFTGSISANKKEIVDVEGIRYLKHADTISLEHNKITDWSNAGSPGGAADYYGFEDETSGEWRNVTWKIAGNPFRKIPANFGGRLIIIQSASTSSTYDEEEQEFKMLRVNTGLPYIINIKRCEIIGGSTPWVDVISVAPNPPENAICVINPDFTDETATVTNIVKSGSQRIGIGTEQDIHFDTIDEWGTITLGSISFKYYISPSFYVYDKVTLDIGTYKGSAMLTKVDAANPDSLLSGAKFQVYQSDGTLLRNEEYVTDGAGKIVVKDLDPGSYYFEEVTAPSGYILDKNKLEFEIKKPSVQMGGMKTIALSDGTTETAGANETFIAGPKGPQSPDIILSSKNLPAAAIVKVVYDRLEGENGPVTEEFKLLKNAETPINEKKNANKILGPVTISVNFTHSGESASGAVELIVKNNKQPDPEDPNNPSDPNLPPTSPETIKVAGTKMWNDDPGYVGVHPEIFVELLQDGKSFKETLLHDGEETYNFGAVPKYADAAKKKEYKYTVKERFKDPAKGAFFSCDQDGYDFVNSHKSSRIPIWGEKTWDDKGLSLVHPDVTINLLRDGTKIDSQVITSGEGGYRFENLPVVKDDTDPNAKPYVYTVEEEPAAGYRSTKLGKYDFLNTYIVPSTGNHGGGGGGGGRSPGSGTPPTGPGITPPGIDPAAPGTNPAAPGTNPSDPGVTRPEGGPFTEEGNTAPLPKMGQKDTSLPTMIIWGSILALAGWSARKYEGIRENEPE